MLSILDCKVIARPNNSLSPENSLKLMMGMAVVIFLISLSFMHVGAWLVLPFAGLELAAFAYAFHFVYLHSNDFESVNIDGDRVVVEKRNFRKISVTEFQRYWTRVDLRNVGGEKGVFGRSGLFISSHGKEVEFGKHFINDEQRALLAQELKQKLKKY